MKLFFYVTLLMATMTVAHAESVECGRLMVRLNVQDQSEKLDILKALEIISETHNFKTKDIIFGPTLIIEYRAGVMDTEQDVLAYKRLVSRLSTLNGVQLICDLPMGPNPRISGSN